jgi:AcrR family transcriptional regulator
MGRWQADAQGRLIEAAMALFGERGYDSTTVADIAERAGLTKRTFFRYFTDKREVLFFGAAALEELIVSAVAGAPASASPLAAVEAGLSAAGPGFEERREFAAKRRQIINANPELQERELIKLASLARAVAGALGRRGVPELTATFAAETGMTVFRVAFERWVDEPDQSLNGLIRESLEQVRSVTRA